MPRTKKYYVYILTNWNHKVLYIGVTSNIEQRIYQHQNKLITGFTHKYNVDKLVYLEEAPDIEAAITREKQLKKWRRDKKHALIALTNPQWHALLT
jgi:putative endonuclease